MSKLFALEDINEKTAETELEATAEVGEVADVQAEVQEEVIDTNEAVEAIDEGIDAADQLEEVEKAVANAAEEEGLDPVAAEAVRIAIEAICARVGANPKVMYLLYAAENFQSASSRKANTKIALESVSEFLRDIWNKIKAAMQRLWKKVKEFWDKHFSSLGRVKKALESMKNKVSSSSGRLKDKAYIEEAPNSLSDAFAGGDISTKVISDFIEAHKKLMDDAGKVADKTSEFNSIANSNFANVYTAKPDGSGITGIEEAIQKLKGTTSMKSDTLVGGLVISYEFREEDDGNVSLEITREYVDKKDKGGVVLAEKNEVKELLNKVLELINNNIKAKAKQEKLQESFNKLSIAVEKAISNVNEEKQKSLRNSMKAVYKINAKAPTIQTEFLNLNVKLARAVINYAALCLKNYK